MSQRGTFNLDDKTAAALEELVGEFGGNKTDALNRAVQGFLVLRRVHAVYVQEAPDEELVKVLFV